MKIRQFQSSDIAGAIRLCRGAGWNQLASDWQRLIEYQPGGCFVAEIDGQLVGTVTSTSYADQLAWIGMMLVDPSYRRRGIATGLLDTCVAWLQGQGIPCIKLDATPEGKYVYERLGFQSEWSFHRWRRASRTTPPPPFQVGMSERSLKPIESLTRWDQEAFGVDRRGWLSRLAIDSRGSYQPTGFAMWREGHLADYLGPVAAANRDAAERLVTELLPQLQRDILWDVPQPNADAVALAHRLQFTPVRDLTRMWLGTPQTPSPRLDLQYALSDPGTG